jgi:hypothetical protein
LVQVAGKDGPELQHPAPDRFVRDLEPSLGQEFLHIPIAEGEAQVPSDRVLDDLRRELVSSI